MIVADQAESLRNMMKQKQLLEGELPPEKPPVNARVITVTSGKGGVGKTNFTVNLGVALSKTGKRVCIIDADFGLANVEVLFGVLPKFNLAHVFNGSKEIGDIISEGPMGVRFLSGGSGLRELANITEVQMEFLVDKLTLLDSMSDVILIDTGAGISDSVLNFIKASKETVIITTPEPTSVTDAYAIIKASKEANSYVPSFKLVVNRVDDYKEGADIFDKMSKVSNRFLNINIENLGYIPQDMNVVKAVKSQQPFVISFPESQAAKAVSGIADRLLDSSLPIDDERAHGLRGFIKRLSGAFK